LASSTANWSSSRVAMVDVALAMESTTAAASGSRGWLEDCEAVMVVPLRGLRGDMAFSMRARIAFWDFLVPKERPRAAREESWWLLVP